MEFAGCSLILIPVLFFFVNSMKFKVFMYSLVDSMKLKVLLFLLGRFNEIQNMLIMSLLF